MRWFLIILGLIVGLVTLFFVAALTPLGNYLVPYYFVIGYLTFVAALVWQARKQQDVSPSPKNIGKYVYAYAKALVVSLIAMTGLYTFQLITTFAFDPTPSRYVSWWEDQLANVAFGTRFLIRIYFLVSALIAVYTYIYTLMYILDVRDTLPLGKMGSVVLVGVLLCIPGALYIFEKHTSSTWYALVHKFGAGNGQAFYALLDPMQVFSNLRLYEPHVLQELIHLFLAGLITSIATYTSTKSVEVALLTEGAIMLGPLVIKTLETIFTQVHQIRDNNKDAKNNADTSS